MEALVYRIVRSSPDCGALAFEGGGITEDVTMEFHSASVIGFDLDIKQEFLAYPPDGAYELVKLEQGQGENLRVAKNKPVVTRFLMPIIRPHMQLAVIVAAPDELEGGVPEQGKENVTALGVGGSEPVIAVAFEAS